MTTKPTYTPALRFPDFLNDGEWEVKRLGDCFSERIERNYNDLPLLSLTESDGIIPQEETNRKNNSNADKSKYLRVCVGDIAYNTMRMWQGRCAYVTIEGIVSPAYTVCKPNEGIDSLFFYYLFKTQQAIEIFHRNSQGLVNDTLSLKFESFKKIKVAVPPLPEQRRIAQALTALDELIAATNEKLEQMKAYKKGLMQKLFPAKGKKLPELRFKEFKKDGEWEVKKLGDIFSLIRNGAMYNTNNTSGFPMSRIETISNGVIDYDRVGYSETELKDYRLNEGDILFSHINSLAHIGKVAYYDGSKVLYHGMNLLVLRCKKSFYPLYIFYLLNTEEMKIALRSIAKRAINQASISTKELAQLLVYIPQKEEQRKIADCFTSIDEMINQYTNKVSFLEVYKKGLMQQMFPHVETQNFASLPTDKQM